VPPAVPAFEVTEPETVPAVPGTPSDLPERHFTIFYNDTGYSYESILLPYATGVKEVSVEEPYLRLQHQQQNFVRFCESLIKVSAVRKINLTTSFDDSTNLVELEERLGELKQSLLEMDIELNIQLNPNMHDREIRFDNGWVIKIGRGIHFHQKPVSWFEIGVNDLGLRKCLETKVDVYRESTIINLNAL